MGKRYYQPGSFAEIQNLRNMLMAYSGKMRITRKLPEVPGLDVVIETEAVSGAELGQDIHDVLLLFW